MTTAFNGLTPDQLAVLNAIRVAEGVSVYLLVGVGFRARLGQDDLQYAQEFVNLKLLERVKKSSGIPGWTYYKLTQKAINILNEVNRRPELLEQTQRSKVTTGRSAIKGRKIVDSKQVHATGELTEEGKRAALTGEITTLTDSLDEQKRIIEQKEASLESFIAKVKELNKEIDDLNEQFYDLHEYLASKMAPTSGEGDDKRKALTIKERLQALLEGKTFTGTTPFELASNIATILSEENTRTIHTLTAEEGYECVVTKDKDLIEKIRDHLNEDADEDLKSMQPTPLARHIFEGSSNLLKGTYKVTTEVMCLLFHDKKGLGKAYRYEGVKPEIWIKLLRAKSAGSYFSRYLKDKLKDYIKMNKETVEDMFFDTDWPDSKLWDNEGKEIPEYKTEKAEYKVDTDKAEQG